MSSALAAGLWQGLRWRAFTLFVGLLLFAGCVAHAPQPSGTRAAGSEVVLEIIKAQVGCCSHPYLVSLRADGTLKYIGKFPYGNMMEKEAKLSPHEIDDALRIADELHTLEYQPERTAEYQLDVALVTIPADQTRSQIQIRVNELSERQMQVFRVFEAKLHIPDLRCPFPIIFGGRQLEACAFEQEVLRERQQERDQRIREEDRK